MKLFFQIIFQIFLILTILAGCASKGGIVHPTYQRTNDVYNAVTYVYYNKSIPFRVTFPKLEWIIYADAHTAPLYPFGDIEKLEKESGGEFAMVGNHISNQMTVLLFIEHGIGGLSPFEYIKVLKEAKKEDFAGATENFTRERNIGDQRCAEFEYQLTAKAENKTVDVTFRELVFLRNNLACRFRIAVATVLYQSLKVKMENIMNTISFS